MTLPGSIFLLILFACVPGAIGEQGDSWHDPVFEISVPKNWTVHRTQEEANSWKYKITDRGTLVFEAQVLKGGPRFIDCACARPEFYRHTNDAVYETWALELQLGEMNFITWKVATGDMRLDIHAHIDAAEIDLLRQVVYSARPRSTKP